MISLPKNLNIDECEETLKLLNTPLCNDLELPVDTAKFAFAGMATAVQAAITWGRRSSTKVLVLRKTKKEIEDQIEEVIRRPHKFTAAMFAKAVHFGKDAQLVDIRHQINLAAKNKIEFQESSPYGNQHGRLCWFAFVDHSNKGFDNHFYISKSDAKPEPRSLSQIRAVIFAMVEKSAQVSGGGALPSGESINQLGRMFYELFINTHEHGSRGENRSDWIKPAVRLIYTHGINLTGEGVEGSLQGEPVLTNYVDRSVDQSRYIEISIIDSGLGFCERWLSDHPDERPADISIQQEYSIFRKCFTFRQSSSGKDEKGNGLPVVMERLTQLKGFMRVRSGRLSLYRDFVASPYIESDDCNLFDWATMRPANEQPTSHALVEGVAITLLIPLEAKQ